MSILAILYTLIINPLELLFEVLFVFANRFINHPGLAIILLSLAVNFLVLPLYQRADAMQEEERRTEEKLRKWEKHIRGTFKGDERFMMLRTYYRQNGYKPSYALKGSFSLLLEIPFFIAAYRFLSSLPLLSGISFGPIPDLGAPDGMIRIAGISINLLPILMTLINVMSGAIYAKGSSLKTKLQLYGMALVFLIFLYQSPAGLVFYWTLNNLFSLIKNVFYKLKNPKKVLCLLSSTVGMLTVLGSLVLMREYSLKSRIFIGIVGLLLQIPLLSGYMIKKSDQDGKENEKDEDPKEMNKCARLFFVAELFSAVLIGFLIPSAVIADSPAEYIDIVNPTNPLSYVGTAFCLAIGIFVIWMGVFFYLSQNRAKRVFMGCALFCCGMFLIDYMFFGTKLGNLSSTFQFDVQPEFSTVEKLINLATLVILGTTGIILSKKTKIFYHILGIIIPAGIITVSLMGVRNSFQINSGYQYTKSAAENAGGYPQINLSTKGRNVVVIMMDRMINDYLPYLMYERQELAEQFRGFTYYPNAVSFSTKTNAGIPGLYGGYEYTPAEMNQRDEELLVSKHNEALKVMPVLFYENGFDVTVCDPTYANYQEIPDLSIYEDYPEIHTYITNGRIYSDKLISVNPEQIYKRNSLFYALMKCSPVLVQKYVYEGGNYNSSDAGYEETIIMTENQIDDGISKAYGVSSQFVKAYNVLDNLSEITDINDSERNTFLMISNDTTHSPCLLQEPEYEPRAEVDNIAYDELHHVRVASDGSTLDLNPGLVYWDALSSVRTKHYHVNMAAMIKLGKWMDYLREMGVYDNTRIIIVSDHGHDLWLNPDWETKNVRENGKGTETYDLGMFHCMLLVKDYNTDAFVTDMQFMTNADVPMIAAKGLIEKPMNPFTGKPIDDSMKQTGKLQLKYTHEWDIKLNQGRQFLPDVWFSVKDDIFDKDNWEYLGYY